MMLHLNKRQWMILCTACGENAWFFNVATLHYQWTGGTQTTAARRVWHQDLRILVDAKQIRAFVDYYTPSKAGPGLMDVNHLEVERVDFRRRMHFRATRKGWSTYRKKIQAGTMRPRPATKSGGYWVVEDTAAQEVWKEDVHGHRID